MCRTGSEQDANPAQPTIFDAMKSPGACTLAPVAFFVVEPGSPEVVVCQLRRQSNLRIQIRTGEEHG